MGYSIPVCDGREAGGCRKFFCLHVAVAVVAAVAVHGGHSLGL